MREKIREVISRRPRSKPRLYPCRKCQDMVQVDKRTFECNQCETDVRKTGKIFMTEEDFNKEGKTDA